jgi:hypothetical protein
MLAGYLLQTIERHSDRLTEALVADLTSNPRTPSFTRLPLAELRERAHGIYRHLADWLGARSEAQIDETFEALGRRRFEERIPLEELVYAIILTKQHLREKVRDLGPVESAIELHYEVDLHNMIGRFFDRAIHATVKGYEQARREPRQEERREQWAKFGIDSSAHVGEWVP